MSLPNAPRSCLGRLAIRISSQTPSSSRLAINPTHRSLHSTRPPLNSLAPSWQARPIPPVTRTRQQTHRPHPRSLATANSGVAPTAAPTAKPIRNPRYEASGALQNITITPHAARRLRAIAAQDAQRSLALRVRVESGGCHGFQYLMSLVDGETEVDDEADTVFEEAGMADGDAPSGEYRARVVMDEPSLELLKGSSVDYTMELIGSQFKIVGIPGAKSSCGCGTSFDVAV